MTKEEIKALVASKIEGQGNQVDLGSALSAIIGGIVDLIPEGGGPKVIHIQNALFLAGGEEELTEAEKQEIFSGIKDGTIVGMVLENSQERVVVVRATSWRDDYVVINFYSDDAAGIVPWTWSF